MVLFSGVIMMAGIMAGLLGSILLLRPHWILPSPTLQQDTLNKLKGDLDSVFQLDMKEQLQHGVSVRNGVTIQYVTNFDAALEKVQTGKHMLVLAQPWQRCGYVRMLIKNIWDPSFTEACDILVCDLSSPDSNGTRLGQHRLHSLFDHPGTGAKQYGTPVSAFVSNGKQVAWKPGPFRSMPPNMHNLSEEARRELMSQSLNTWVAEAKKL